MKNFYLFIGFVSVCFFNINAQEIISTSGDYFENTNGSVSWTVGESMIETYTNGADILTQGFQQGRLTAVSVFELEDIDISVKIAPNPTMDFINLYTDNFKDLTYQLYDFNGKIIKQADIISYETKISFSKLSYAAYFLKIMKGAQIIKTFQIIKQ
ncbi:MAG: T9SS type A sorting domain-containing protein [Bacteroidales bacterium]|nr:T9SS type A sorting domain-containing protein [Bacteroidales bacterium]